ncbi:MAG: phage baseplate assembly protein [Magnetospirillum sp.]|nr:phage baseplate assembly protein [Magnetospirillum sp.]
MVNPFAATLQGIKDRLAMMVGRGVLAALQSDNGLMRAALDGLPGEVLDDREYVLDYGISSRAHPGAEALMLFLAGLRSNGVVVRLFDRRYSITLEYGEVAIHDDLGQMVHLTRTGIVVNSPLDVTIQAGNNATIKAGKKLRLEAEDIEQHATKSSSWDVAGFGQRWTWVGGVTWENMTWQIGATVTSTPLPIHPPEGP